MPVLLAAAPMRIPVVLWEGNAIPGRAVRATARLADALAVSYESAGTRAGRRRRPDVRHGHADPRRDGDLASRRPGPARPSARRPDDPDLRGLAGGPALQRRGRGRAAATRGAGPRPPRHRGERLRGRPRRTRASARGSSRPVPAVTVPARGHAGGPRRDRPRRWPGGLVDRRRGHGAGDPVGDRAVSPRRGPTRAQTPRSSPRRARPGSSRTRTSTLTRSSRRPTCSSTSRASGDGRGLPGVRPATGRRGVAELVLALAERRPLPVVPRRSRPSPGARRDGGGRPRRDGRGREHGDGRRGRSRRAVRPDRRRGRRSSAGSG